MNSILARPMPVVAGVAAPATTAMAGRTAKAAVFRGSKAAMPAALKKATSLKATRRNAARAAVAIGSQPLSLVEKTKGSNPELEAKILKAAEINNCLTETDLGLPDKYSGKVRDKYDAGDYLVFVITDRQSAFDRTLCAVPFKGQVLNQTSTWWLDNTTHIIPNALVSNPDPNVCIMSKCQTFPIEFVVRGYMTGSTSTSLWTVYKNGSRNYTGNILPDGLQKNCKLEKNILTPTTKEASDRPITPEDIVEEGWMSQASYDICAKAAMELFEFGQQEAAKRGLILVDTKYEFGRNAAGDIVLIDEIHTPDSSRYWVKESYESRFAAGEEPENVDKEFLRIWFADHCDPYKDEILPEAPVDLRAELSRRYVMLYETITGTKFQLPDLSIPAEERMTTATNAELARLRG